MPIVPLFQQPAIPDAWHQVTAPGGYECWHFDAADSAGELRMLARFYQGYVFHPGYLRAYGKYLRRPTRNAPPMPAEYPCVHFTLYRGCEIVAQFLSQFPADRFAAATDRVDVSIASNTLRSCDDGSLEIQLNGVPSTTHGPKLPGTQSLSASFRFTPRFNHPPVQRTIFSRRWSGAEHQWIIANPLCNVTGQIELRNAGTNNSQHFTLNGQGYHDHNFGAGPIGPGIKRWMRGRLLLEDHAAMVHFAQPKDAGIADEIHLIEANELEIRDLPINRFNADWSPRTAKFLHYPAWVEAGPLQMVNPTILDASPFCLRLAYDASLRGINTTAICEIANPHRLSWPILGRMIERTMNVEKGAASAESETASRFSQQR